METGSKLGLQLLIRVIHGNGADPAHCLADGGEDFGRQFSKAAVILGKAACDVGIPEDRIRL